MTGWRAAAERLVLLAMLVILPVAFLPAGLTPFTGAKTDAFGVLALALLALRAAGGRAALRATADALAGSPVAVPAVAAALAAVVTGGSPGIAFGAGVALVIASSPESIPAGRAARMYVAVMVAIATYACLQCAGQDPFGWDRSFAGGAPPGTFGNPLFLGTALAGALPLAVAGWLAARRPAPVRAMTVAMLGAALLAAQARGAWAGALVAVAALALHPVVRDAVRSGLGRRRLVTAGAVAAVAGLGLAVAGAPLVRHLSGVADPAQWRGRLLLWESTARMVRERPLVGRGSGGVRRDYLAFQGRLLAEPRYASLPYRSTAHSHDDWLQFAAERGIPGLGTMLWLLAAALVPLARGRTPLAAHVAGCALLGWCVDATVNGPLHVPPSSDLVWVLIGFAAQRPAGLAPRRLQGGPSRAGPAVAALAASALLALPFARDLAGDAYLGAGATLPGGGDPAPALRALGAADALLREDRRQHFHAGRVWFGAGRFREASAEFALDVTANPGVHSGWHNLGLALRALHRPDDARAAFTRAADLNPRDPESRRLAAEPLKRRANRPL